MTRFNARLPRTVSMTKAPSAAGSPAATAPRTVLGAVAAMGVAAIASLIAGVSLYTVGNQLFRLSVTANKKLKAKDRLTAHQLHERVASTQKTEVITTVLVLAILAFLAVSAMRGRHWSRWGVSGFWFLSTFTGMIIGITSVLSVGVTDIPAVFRIPGFIAGVAMIVAVVLVNLRPSVSFFALSKPAPRPGAPARRGLFGGAPARGAATAAAPATTRPAARGDDIPQSRTKKRAETAAVAKGAELARSRAKEASRAKAASGSAAGGAAGHAGGTAARAARASKSRRRPDA